MADRADQRWARRWRANYFSVASLLLLLFTLIGFSDNLFTDVRQPSNFDPKFIVHGLFCLAWMILLVVQSLLVRARGMRWHRRLGVVGGVVAAGVTLSTLYVFVMVWTSWRTMTLEVRTNRMLLAGLAWFAAVWAIAVVT